MGNLHNLDNRGVWVSIHRPNGGGAVEGWLIGETPQGFLVALDEDLEDVRLVSNYVSISYNHKKLLPKLKYDNAREIQEKMWQTNEAILEPMQDAISRIKFDRLHEFCRHSKELERLLYRAKEERKYGYLSYTPLNEWINSLIVQADRSTPMHREVYETLEDSGLTEVIGEYGPKLAQLPAELTIPAYDLEFETREELTSSLESTRDQPWTRERHREFLKAAEETRIRLIRGNTKEHDKQDEANSEETDDSTLFSRWIGPSLRVLVGTGLAIANTTVGVTAGLTTTIATIGATAVPTYLGVATSIYTGLAQVSDGLEKIGRSK
jgi:hypothetical protein